MDRKETILYYCHVDWEWIKQRPQFIAEGLAAHYDVYVHYRKQYHRGNLVKENTTGVHLQPFRTLPALKDRFSLLTGINLLIRKRKLKHRLNRISARILWLTHPVQIYEVPKSFQGLIIYDCMDDQLHLNCPKAWEGKISEAEHMLVGRADIVLASSSYLVTLLCRRYPDANAKIHLVRNACSPDILNQPYIPFRNDGDGIIAGYIGTVSSWFDFPVVMKSLDMYPDLHYWIIGPCEDIELPRHPRLHFKGVVEHERLCEYIPHIQFFVMPFVINEITECVDPVKMYEYAAFGRPILASDYPEIHYFEGLSAYYQDETTYCQRIGELIERENTEQEAEKARMFLSNNTWDNRIQMITGIISEHK